MMAFNIVPLYAGLLAVFFIFLSFQVIKYRRKFLIGVGEGEQPLLQRAVRVHSNFAEYVPFALVLLMLLEGQGAATWLLHGLGVLLIIGRISHAYGLSQVEEKLIFRQVGMMSTFLVILISGVSLLF